LLHLHDSIHFASFHLLGCRICWRMIWAKNERR
jgi:hypothetical protein